MEYEMRTLENQIGKKSKDELESSRSFRNKRNSEGKENGS